MENDHSPLDLRLRSLLCDAHLSAKQVGGAAYDVCIPAALREWVVSVRMTEAWVSLRTYVLALPDSAEPRAALLEAAMHANGRMSLTKFSLADENALHLDLEYRQEHLDSSVLRNLVCLAVKVGEAEYPRLFRIATAEAALDSLESAFNRSGPDAY
jgi:hypothetical protein